MIEETVVFEHYPYGNGMGVGQEYVRYYGGDGDGKTDWGGYVTWDGTGPK